MHQVWTAEEREKETREDQKGNDPFPLSATIHDPANTNHVRRRRECPQDHPAWPVLILPTALPTAQRKL